MTVLQESQEVLGKKLFSVRKALEHYITDPENFAVMDKTSYRLEPNHNTIKAIANMYDPIKSAALVEKFEKIRAEYSLPLEFA